MLTNNPPSLVEASEASVLGLWMTVFSLGPCMAVPLRTPLSSSLLAEGTRTHPCDLICKTLQYSHILRYMNVYEQYMKVYEQYMNEGGTTEDLPYAN